MMLHEADRLRGQAGFSLSGMEGIEDTTLFWDPRFPEGFESCVMLEFASPALAKAALARSGASAFRIETRRGKFAPAAPPGPPPPGSAEAALRCFRRCPYVVSRDTPRGGPRRPEGGGWLLYFPTRDKPRRDTAGLVA